MQKNDCNEGFCGVGEWQGVAEVYDSSGRFLANGADQRHVRTLMDDGRTRIDLSFVGPLKFAGHYYIKSEQDRRLYQGPVNCGYAEPLGKEGVSAHAYWPAIGMSQKFFLMMTPDGQKQVSMALMSRGEHLLYAILGENSRVDRSQPVNPDLMVCGAACDLAQDPKAGYPEILLHRSGVYEGELTSQWEGKGGRQTGGARHKIESRLNGLSFTVEGSVFAPEGIQCALITNQWQAWSEAGDFVGSYSMYGGRGLSGHFHDLKRNLRVWRRELVTSSGEHKCIVNLWYEGEKKIGSEWGFLKYRA